MHALGIAEFFAFFTIGTAASFFVSLGSRSRPFGSFGCFFLFGLRHLITPFLMLEFIIL